MTRLIAIFIILVGIFCGYQLFRYWDKVKHEDETRQQDAASAVVQPERLPGLPAQLEASLRAVQQQGPAAFRNWVKTYDRMIQDPRKAWIELDYCVAIAREDPSEARRVFASVKARLSPASPVWPRVVELERAYE